MKCKNKVPLYDLLLEMLDAHRIHRPVKPSESWFQGDRDSPTTSSTSSSGGGGGDDEGTSSAGSSSGPQGSQESPRRENLSRAPTGPGVLQYRGPHSDCTRIL